jgi:hypothetical protein
LGVEHSVSPPYRIIALSTSRRRSICFFELFLPGLRQLENVVEIDLHVLVCPQLTTGGGMTGPANLIPS